MTASSCRMCFSIGFYLPLLPGGEGKECLYQHRRDGRTQPASVEVITAEGWHTVKGQQPLPVRHRLPGVPLKPFQAYDKGSHAGSSRTSLQPFQPACQVPESVTKRCFSLAG